MKSSIFPHRRWGAVLARLLAALLLLLGMRTGLHAQSALSPLASGKFLHLRITDYDVATIRRGNPFSVQRDARTGAELVYEKVTEEGRGRRLLLGWTLNASTSRSMRSGGSTSVGTSSQHRFRIGWGKSQTYLWKRLVMRGGLDNYLQFDTGLKVETSTRDTSGAVTIRNDLKDAPAFQFALRPFLGLGLQVSPRFAVGIESGLLLSLNAVLGNSRTVSYSAGVGTSDTRNSAFSLVLDARPSTTLPFVVLTYQF
jgi:hypothetical protein